MNEHAELWASTLNTLERSRRFLIALRDTCNQSSEVVANNESLRSITEYAECRDATTEAIAAIERVKAAYVRARDHLETIVNRDKFWPGSLDAEDSQ